LRFLRLLKRLLLYGLLALVLVTAASLLWLRWDSHAPRDQWFDERRGRLEDVRSEQSMTPHGQLAETVVLRSSSGLEVLIRLIRDVESAGKQAVLVVLGGHRTGSDAVDLFGDVGDRVVVGIDYPYDGPEKVRGFTQIVGTIPLARRAMLDTVPAVSLAIDWLLQQPWTDQERVIVIGGSLGVPFATTAAMRDTRIRGALLVHGAADNRLWIEAQLARRIDLEMLHYPLSVLLHWLAYGPALDTSERIKGIAPRPVVIIGARNDERTPSGQAELLYELAGEPKRLRFTEGAHIEPDRSEIIEALLRIAEEEMPFLTGGEP
jgi:acetyl esterase/lipase